MNFLKAAWDTVYGFAKGGAPVPLRLLAVIAIPIGLDFLFRGAHWEAGISFLFFVVVFLLSLFGI